MSDDAGLVVRIWEYLIAAGIYWWAALAVLLGIERVTERAFPSFWRERIDPWFTATRRKQLLIGFAVLAFAIGNFRAWDEERAAKVRAQQRLASANTEAMWAPLTSAEASTFARQVRNIPPEDIVVACETINCRDLADGLAKILQGTPGWTVIIYHGGGFDITGVTGIRLHPKEPATELLRKTIEATTNLKVTLLDETREQVGSNQSFLVVGTKPF